MISTFRLDEWGASARLHVPRLQVMPSGTKRRSRLRSPSQVNSDLVALSLATSRYIHRTGPAK